MATASTDQLRMPVVKHLYQNHVLDSSRWNFLPLREDDIIVATSYKAGTTWMQAIVGNLIFSGQELPAPLSELSPFLEFRMVPLELVLAGLERQRNRRFINPSSARRVPIRPAPQVRLCRSRCPRRLHVVLEPLPDLHRRNDAVDESHPRPGGCSPTALPGGRP